MERRYDPRLDAWLSGPDRKPLVLRGARQVGKTWLVRELARRAGRDLVELNFERDPGLRRYFTSNDPAHILGELSLFLGREIRPDRALLFLDEIQAAGETIAKLRWFYEEMPALPVVAAGSLLEFTLADHDFSMPVGRVTFRHIQPMTFPEYLVAAGRTSLAETLAAWRPEEKLSTAAHDAATSAFDRFAMVGGMPEAVRTDIEGGSARAVREVQRDLVATYRADFAKYSGRMKSDVLDATLLAVSASIGEKFTYSRVGQGVKHHQAKKALELLSRARLCHIVRRTAANGLPLGGEASERSCKAILGDVGLFHALVGTPAVGAFPQWDSLAPSVRGRLVEQVAGQELRSGDPGSAGEPVLYTWRREGGRLGEIDYVIASGGGVVPVELKSGTSGSMKSLHQFMFDKGLTLAVRSDRNPPGEMAVSVRTTRGDDVTYDLLGLPPYLLWNLDPILDAHRRGRRTG